MTLDRNLRESRREEKRMRGKEGKKTLTFWQPQTPTNRKSKIQVWPRRGEVQQQWATTGPAPMEGVKRMNAVVVRGQEAEPSMGVPPRWDPYAMEVDRGRNCYTCGGFRHMACYYRNKGRERPMDGRRVEYGEGRIKEINNHKDNLKGVENLELLN